MCFESRCLLIRKSSWLCDTKSRSFYSVKHPQARMPSRGEQNVSLSQKAYEILEKAKKKGETLSDVVVRLSETKIAGLQRRGEKEIMTSDGKRLVVRIDQDKCAGAESCVSTAPE